LYELTAAPLPAGAVQINPTPTLEIFEVAITGADGTVRGITVRETLESVDPESLNAVTLNTYELALLRPVIVVGVVSISPGVHSVHVVSARSL
jgi:hypothetical protein